MPVPSSLPQPAIAQVSGVRDASPSCAGSSRVHVRTPNIGNGKEDHCILFLSVILDKSLTKGKIKSRWSISCDDDRGPTVAARARRADDREGRGCRDIDAVSDQICKPACNDMVPD